MKVQVTHILVYDHVRRRPGEILTLKDKAHFTPSCMVKVENSAIVTGPTPIGPIKEGNVPEFNPPPEVPDVDEDTTTSARKPTSMSEAAKKRRKPKKAGEGVGKK